MARRPNPVLRALWRDRVRRHSMSGMSVDEFCAQGRFARSAFYRWRRLLAVVESSDQPSTPSAPSTFLPVTLRLGESNVHQPAPVEADLPNGIRLRIPTADVVLACRLVRVIASAKTHSGGWG
jgi:hypothetical protein